MSRTYTISNATANTGTVTVTPGVGVYIPSGGGTFGSTGQIYTTNGTTGLNWATTSPYDTVMKINQSPPELEVKGRMVINGQDLEERLNTIEKVLQIPERDVKLETKHPKLKELYDAYIHALGKYRTWDAIKGEDND
jgi:DNA-binding beta-propeller fold protein YncE